MSNTTWRVSHKMELQHMSSLTVVWWGPFCSFALVFLCCPIMCLVCCGVRCGFVLRAMFGLSLPSVVCGRVRVLFVCLRMVVGGVCCVVFLFFFVLCTLCCPILWTVNFVLLLRYSLTFIDICIAVGDPVIKRRSFESHQPIQPRHTCVPFPSHDLDFQRNMSW